MASRPPPPSHLPPPRHESRTQTSPYQASTEVDQAIARRRAELRRLQAKSSGPRPLPPIAAGATKTTPGWTPQDRNTGTPIFAPSVRNTPSTAAVARRLDNSYGPPVTKPPQTKPDLSQYKRTSEVFPHTTNLGATPVTVGTPSFRTAQTQPSKAAASPNRTFSAQHSQATPSPYGAARATLVPVLPVGDKNTLIPPLMLEPVAKSFSNEQQRDSKQIAKNGDSKQTEKQGDDQVLKETLSQIVNTVSGASTPIMSNSLSTEKVLFKANEALLDSQKHVSTCKETVSNVSSTKFRNATSSSSVKQRVDGKERRMQQPPRSKSAPSLIEQLNRAVALKGEKAVIGMLEKLENPMLSPYNPPNTPRGRSRDLLSSLGAPLTPRSRPSSPERWNNNNPPSEKKIYAKPLPKGDKLEMQYIVDAAKIIPNEYESDLVNYIIRGPNSSDIFHYDFFSSENDYRESFDVDNSETVEVLAKIETDGSEFVLVGKDARYGKYGGERKGEEESLEWSVFEDLENSSLVLGSVTYIDMEGNEREYCLESIYDEAVSIRESYCTSIRSAACALKHASKNGGIAERITESVHNKSENSQFIPQVSREHLPAMSSTNDPDNSLESSAMTTPNRNHFVSVGPSPSHVPSTFSPGGESMQNNNQVNQPPKDNVVNLQTSSMHEKISVKQSTLSEKEPMSSSTSGQAQKQKQSENQLEEFESADSALPTMIFSLFSMFFSIVWFLLFKLPYRVCSMALTFCVVLMCLRVLWLLLADDNGAWEMGAGVDLEYNTPGIY